MGVVYVDGTPYITVPNPPAPPYVGLRFPDSSVAFLPAQTSVPPVPYVGLKFPDSSVAFISGIPPVPTSSYLLLKDGTTVSMSAADIGALSNSGGGGATITVNGQQVVKENINGAIFGPEFASVTATPDYFLDYMTGMTYLDLRGFTGLTSMGNYNLANCDSYNRPVTIPDGVTSIGFYFMQTVFGNSFNSPVTLPAGLLSINNGFLYGCNSFNQPVDLPNSLTSIGAFFLYGCTAFNSPIDLPYSLKSIGTGFLYECVNFNQLLYMGSIADLESIQGSFLYKCASFNQPITFSNTITSIGQGLLRGCDSLVSRVTINCPAATIPTGGDPFAADLIDAPAYTQGIPIYSSTHSIVADILARFPQKDDGPYRKLVSDI